MQPPPFSPTFRAFRRDDAATLMQWLESDVGSGLGVPPAGSAWVDHLVTGQNVEGHIAMDQTGRPIGFLRLDGQAGKVLELTVVVHPHWQRRGVGRRIVQHGKQRCLARGSSLLVAVCAERNLKGRRFFTSLGFKSAAGGPDGWLRFELWLHGATTSSAPLVIEP
jgi:GNAT superfamily N-acetyltransferase